MSYYLKTIDETLQEINSTENGLSSAEAARRLETNGHNRLAEPPKKSLLGIYLSILARVSGVSIKKIESVSK